MTPEEAKKLKPGDIVLFEGGLYFVTRGGDEHEVEIYMDCDYCWVRSSELKLVCAVEDREDRKEES